MGCVCIIDDRVELLGIITEGDIRRALKNKNEFFKLKKPPGYTRGFFYALQFLGLNYSGSPFVNFQT